MNRRRAVAIVVEGSTDATILTGPMSRIFKSVGQEVVFWAAGDVTSNRKLGEKTFSHTVAQGIEKALDQRGLCSADLDRIIHITDLDGAFIPNDKIYDGWENKGFFYGSDGIHAQSSQAVIDRNARKRRRINELLKVESMIRVPYRLYYMCQNLEHVVADERNCDNKSKGALAKEKRALWEENPRLFFELVTANDHGCRTWEESWDYARSDMHSLDRGTNLRFAFPEEWEDMF